MTQREMNEADARAIAQGRAIRQRLDAAGPTDPTALGRILAECYECTTSDCHGCNENEARKAARVPA